MRTDRQLLPDVDGLKLPAALARAQAEDEKAKARTRKAHAEVRQAELAVKSAEREDAKRRREAVAADKPTPKPTKPDAEAALKDAEARAQDAVQLARQVEDQLAKEMSKAKPELVEQLDTDAEAAEILADLDQVGSKIERLANNVGALRLFVTIEESQARARPHKPFRTGRDMDRHANPAALLGGLRDQIADLRAAADQLRAGVAEQPATEQAKDAVYVP